MEKGRALSGAGLDWPQMSSFQGVGGDGGPLRFGVVKSLNPAGPQLRSAFCRLHGWAHMYRASVSPVGMVGLLTSRTPEDRWRSSGRHFTQSIATPHSRSWKPGWGQPARPPLVPWVTPGQGGDGGFYKAGNQTGVGYRGVLAGRRRPPGSQLHSQARVCGAGGDL